MFGVCGLGFRAFLEISRDACRGSQKALMANSSPRAYAIQILLGTWIQDAIYLNPKPQTLIPDRPSMLGSLWALRLSDH